MTGTCQPRARAWPGALRPFAAVALCFGGAHGPVRAAPLARPEVATAARTAPHPRLYFTAAELPRLRRDRRHGERARIWRNIERTADWCLTRTPRRAWIAPATPDPIYENLYDRFYAIMGDLAITEHLAFAYALSGEPRYGEGARRWALASCRAWKREADGEPDGGKAYAVTRLLKGVAVAYDCVYDRLTDDERAEMRGALAAIGRKYADGYFLTPAIAGPGFHTHHAVVEWASFGVMALALLDEVPEARSWVDAAVRKFRDHLLPTGLADDGAQVEGATFWASTMQYRLFFMDALRRVTGVGLFGPYRRYMSADLALASVAERRRSDTYSQDNETVVLEPYYGQIDYYAPVLLALAREYRLPTLQYLGLWDGSAGSIQRTRAVTPHGEPLLFELGGYAYLWYDSSVRPAAVDTRLSRVFRSVDEAYARASWRAGDLLVGVRKGAIAVHAGGHAVLADVTDGSTPPPDLRLEGVDDDGERATIRFAGVDGQAVTLVLDRRERRVVIRRRMPATWRFYCQGAPARDGNRIAWGNRVGLVVRSGALTDWRPGGYAPALMTGLNRLALADPAPPRFDVGEAAPDGAGEIVVEVRQR